MRIGDVTIARPAVMGILNLTPDSFSDGGRFIERDVALRQAQVMLDAGAAIIDVGGESTRPGADDVTVADELDRVLPVIRALRDLTDRPISIDTGKPEVMREAVAAGAAMINDVRALRAPGAVEAAAELGVHVCLMHMQGEPRTMQTGPRYDDVVGEIAAFLAGRRDVCVAAGIDRHRILLDPGFGFGKTLAHNVELLANLRQLTELGQPLLVGLSRKAMLGELTGRGVSERLPASVAAAVIAVLHGASIVRAHDVGETVDALHVARAFLDSGV
ncbi:MAG: dihydropteroate synthase [Woeseiaceae bacterium]|nr:dihydropteroate synthase [Woeseiaceae bacterium]